MLLRAMDSIPKGVDDADPFPFLKRAFETIALAMAFLDTPLHHLAAGLPDWMVDDAFVVALALKSPEFEILGFTAAFGDTPARARMLDRLLGEAGRGDIPVAMGTAASLPKTCICQFALP